MNNFLVVEYMENGNLIIEYLLPIIPLLIAILVPRFIYRIPNFKLARFVNSVVTLLIAVIFTIVCSFFESEGLSTYRMLNILIIYAVIISVIRSTYKLIKKVRG